jgi:hypothetical protein
VTSLIRTGGDSDVESDDVYDVELSSSPVVAAA